MLMELKSKNVNMLNYIHKLSSHSKINDRHQFFTFNTDRSNDSICMK
jgi:hypothetical protein